MKKEQKCENKRTCTKEVGKVIFPFLLALVLGSVLAITQASPTTTVSIGDIVSAPNETVTTPVLISNVENYGAGTLSITYNPAVVHVTDVTNSANSTVIAWKADNISGIVNMSAWNLQGISGDIIFANVTFKAVGKAGSITPLNISITVLQNASGDIPAIIKNGSFSIKTPHPPSPFLIFGHVFYENNSECNNPIVNVTNLNTSKQWTARTNANSNYYQLIISHGIDVVTGKTLQFDVKSSDGSQLNTTIYMINQDDVDNGGLFNFNISLKPPAIHDINLTTDYEGAVNGINITRDGTEVVEPEGELIIGQTYNIRYKIVNEGDFNESMAVTVKVANETWNETIGTHNYSLKIGESKTYKDIWDIFDLAPDEYNITVNASIPEDAHPDDNERTRQVTLVLPAGPNITDWYNNKTKNNSTAITINESECVFFNATANQSIDVWSWFVNDVNQSHNFDNFTYCGWTVNATYYVKVNATNANGTSNTITWTVTVIDITPPASIINLTNTTGNFWINWTWGNPPDTDFNHTMVYINGTFVKNVSATYYNATYQPHLMKTISTHTVDVSGSINETWVNQTTTIPNNEPMLETIGAKETNETETLTLDVNATDLDGDTLTYSCNQTDLFADFNTSTGEGSWAPSQGEAGTYYVDFGVAEGYGGMDNETVKITVNSINTPPWWDIIPDQTINEDTNLTLNLIGYVHDNETAVENLSLSIVQWDSTSFSVCEINETHYLIAHPKPDWFGFSSGFVVKATDEGLLSNISNVFCVNVTPVNDAPLIAPIPNQTHRVCDPWNVTINVTDVDTLITSDMITTSDPGNVTVYNVTTLTLHYTEIVTNKPVTVTVNDSQLSDSTTFYVTTYNASVMELNISVGWNLISTPWYIEPGDVQTIRVTQGLNFSICEYNTTAGLWETPKELQPLHGYWIYMWEAGTIVFNKRVELPQVPPYRELKGGWNLIGPSFGEEDPLEEGLNATEVFASLAELEWPTFSHLVLYNETTAKYTTYTAVRWEDAEAWNLTLCPGQGCWVGMKYDDTLLGRL